MADHLPDNSVPRLRLTLAGALAVLMAVLVAPAFAQAAPIVEVKPIQGPKAAVDLRDLSGDEDVNSVGYAIRSQADSQTETVTGFSLEKILVESGADIFAFDYVEVLNPSGGSVLLTRDQVRTEGAFPDGQPVVFDRNDEATFIRPSSRSDDNNSADFFSSSPLQVIVHKGQLIELEASASKTKAKVGEEITFTAQITQQASGSSPEISWSFNDGNGSDGDRVRHEFDRPGKFVVAVSAVTADDQTGGVASVTVQIGEPKKGGPNRDGGGKDDDKDAGDSGASDGTGGEEGGTGDIGSTGTGTTPTPISPSFPSTPTPTTGRPGKPDKTKDDEPERIPSGDRVAGDLLSGVDLENAEILEAPPEEQPEDAPMETLRTGTPSDESGFTVPGAALAGVGALGLIGLGALVEMGSLAGAGAATRRRFDGVSAMIRR